MIGSAGSFERAAAGCGDDRLHKEGEGRRQRVPKPELAGAHGACPALEGHVKGSGLQ